MLINEKLKPRHEIKGLVDQETMRELFDMVADLALDDMVFVETGCLAGSSICYLGQRLKSLGKKVKLNCIDVWEGYADISRESHNFMGVPNNDYFAQFQENIKICELEDMITIHKGSSLDIVKEFEDQSVDYAFFDAHHAGTFVEAELEAWLPKMKRHSMVSGHDYSYIESHVKKVLYNYKYNITDLEESSNRASYWAKLGNGMGAHSSPILDIKDIIWD